MKRLAPLAAVLVLAGPALAEPAPMAQPYQIDLSVEHDGREVVRIRTQITEDGPATASATAGGVDYRFVATLWAVQGDGPQAQLALEAHLTRDEEELAAPTLTFLRGKEAAIEVGRDDGEVLRMTASPVE